MDTGMERRRTRIVIGGGVDAQRGREEGRVRSRGRRRVVCRRKGMLQLFPFFRDRGAVLLGPCRTHLYAVIRVFSRHYWARTTVQLARAEDAPTRCDCASLPPSLPSLPLLRLPTMVFIASPALLTDAQKTSFSRDGYLILRNVLSPAAQQDLIQWTSDVKAWPDLAGMISPPPSLPLLRTDQESTGQHMPYLEIDAKGRKVVSRVENFANYHEGFSGLLRGSQIVGILEELAGEEMHLFKVSVGGSSVAWLDWDGD